MYRPTVVSMFRAIATGAIAFATLASFATAHADVPQGKSLIASRLKTTHRPARLRQVESAAPLGQSDLVHPDVGDAPVEVQNTPPVATKSATRQRRRVHRQIPEWKQTAPGHPSAMTQQRKNGCDQQGGEWNDALHTCILAP